MSGCSLSARTSGVGKARLPSRGGLEADFAGILGSGGSVEFCAVAKPELLRGWFGWGFGGGGFKQQQVAEGDVSGAAGAVDCERGIVDGCERTVGGGAVQLGGAKVVGEEQQGCE